MLRNTPLSSTGACRAVWNVSHSEMNPLSNGIPEMDRQPIRKNTAVCGMRRIRPPMLFRSYSCVACAMAPAPRNNSPLNRAWLRMWYSAAISPITPSILWPVPMKIMDRPRPERMMPMFSIEL